MRMRFITANTSMYLQPVSDAAANFTKTASIDLSNSTLAFGASQRSALGTSVQGPYGTGATQPGGGAARYIGQLWTQNDSTSYPAELYTNQIVYMGEVSIELAQIKYIDMSST